MSNANRDISVPAKVAVWSAGLLVFLLILGSIALNLWLIQRNSQINSERQQLTEQYTDLYGQYLEEVGSRPDTPTPQEVKSVQGPAGTPGAVGPSGKDGEDGKTPTDAELYALLTVFCAGRNNCVGPQGPAGTNGANGADSTVPGPVGPQGPQGEPGRSVTSIVCDGGGSVVYYDQYGIEISRVNQFCIP